MRNAFTQCPDVSIGDVAYRLFAEVGFKKTTVSDIARDLGMSPANIYRFFSSKAAIDEAVASRLLRETEAAGESIVKGSGSAKTKLHDFLAIVEKNNNDRFQFNRKLHDLLETAFSANWPVAKDHVVKITNVLCEIISEGDRTGELAVSDAPLMAMLLRDACMRFWHPRVLAECFEHPEPALDDVVNFCLAAMAQTAPVSAPRARDRVQRHSLDGNVSLAG